MLFEILFSELEHLVDRHRTEINRDGVEVEFHYVADRGSCPYGNELGERADQAGPVGDRAESRVEASAEGPEDLLPAKPVAAACRCSKLLLLVSRTVSRCFRRDELGSWRVGGNME